jgi:hypothetical protein
MAINLKWRGKLIADGFDQKFKEQIKKGLVELGGEAKDQIITRTLEGRNADDKPFTKYSKSYAAFKKDSGKDSEPPNMSYTGDMLRSIQVGPDVKENASGRFVIELNLVGTGRETAEKVQKIKNYQFFGFGKKIQSYIDRKLEKLLSLKEANK